MTPLLSIGIPTIPERRDKLRLLLHRLYASLGGHLAEVEIQVHLTPRRNEGGPNISQKRNQLLEIATGKFCVQIDDDDMVSHNYIPALLAAIKAAPKQAACIAHEIKVVPKRGKSTLALVSNRYDDWSSGLKIPGVPYTYTQSPYYKIPILTEIAKSEKFNESKTWGEDYLWSMALRKHMRGLPEGQVLQPLYTYNMPENPNPKTRY